MNKKLSKIKKPGNNTFLYSVYRSLIVSTVPVLISLMQLENPYFLHYKFLKILIYSLTLFIPAIVEILLGFVRIRVSSLGFFILSYLIYFCIYLSIFYFYYKKNLRDRNRFIKKVFIWILIYLILSFLYLW